MRETAHDARRSEGIKNGVHERPREKAASAEALPPDDLVIAMHIL